ncbi:MAG: hypothetical protein IPH35_24200 [Rhodoferax sp.]|nr:hypothetical protein [Rhodoferax sp.]
MATTKVQKLQSSTAQHKQGDDPGSEISHAETVAVLDFETTGMSPNYGDREHRSICTD